MCGITGYSGRGDQRILESMNATLHHRGPDDAGIMVTKNGGETSIGLAQCRLSIIDTSPAGHQPMSNEDGTVTIVFNGEIYNYAELRRELKTKHVWKSQTDTEVIIHLYEEIGTRVFSEIHGMFAIALYDAKTGRLILARDRLGKKPLFWGLHGGNFIFGSELKALQKHPAWKGEIDPLSLNKYLTYEYVPTPASIFRNTYKLEPGTFLIWDGKEAKKTQFWQPTFLPKETSFADGLNKLDQTLASAVNDRLVADVPLGIFLSGGLDSSTVAYYASREHKNIKTFSIGFKEASFDESSYARQVAKHLGTDHYEKILSVNDSLEIMPRIAELLDEPMADASIVPTYLLSQFTREHVTVALGGDGGDELFCGYDTLLAHRLAPLYELWPEYGREALWRAVANLLPTSYKHLSLDFKIKKFISGFEGGLHERNQRWLSPFGRSERREILSPSVWQKVQFQNEFEDIERYVSSSDSTDFFDRLAMVFLRTFMMDEVLVKVDRASMMNSLEVRAPFLDTRVVDLANHMPTSWKFHGLTRKYILKKLMEGKLPNEIIYRKKKGFAMPIGMWLRNELRPWCDDLLSKQSIESTGLFNYEAVNEMKLRHYSGRENNYLKLRTLLIFMGWWRKYGK